MSAFAQWKDRGWVKEIEGGTIWWSGKFITSKGEFYGLMRCTTGKIKRKYDFYVYIKNPPRSVKLYPNPLCIRPKGGGVWSIHWRGASGADEALISTEYLIIGSRNIL